jgi:hypothetical protein
MQVVSNISGNPPTSTPIYENLFDFIDDVLCDFKLSSKDANGNLDTAENMITQDIEISLNEEAHIKDTIFAFQNQHQEKQATTDIGVYLRRGHDFFCWIEAKRLPTPKENNRDEREYVIVSQIKENGKKVFRGNGGIQRFKEGNHASKLPYSIMIGYIQDNNSDYWLDKINCWIRQLINEDSSFWNENDCLCEQKSSKCNRYVSTHNRKKELGAIMLHHFWIKL